jgi:hypothetical protein
LQTRLAFEVRSEPRGQLRHFQIRVDDTERNFSVFEFCGQDPDDLRLETLQVM